MKLLAKDMHVIIYYNGAVSLTFNCGLEIREELQELTEGDYIVTVEKVGKKRSLNQNALLWELIGQIGMRENGSRANDAQIYVNILKAAGVKVIPVTIPEEEFDRFCRTSDYRGIDRVYEFTNRQGKPFVTCYCYVGSSHMDTAEMNAVISKAIEYANEIGIDTDAYERSLRDTGRNDH